jgi:hypothetical protein
LFQECESICNSLLLDKLYASNAKPSAELRWQDLHDDDKTCMQSSYWELVLENGQ